jgi:hypothetical protein
VFSGNSSPEVNLITRNKQPKENANLIRTEFQYLNDKLKHSKLMIGAWEPKNQVG